MNQSKYNCFHDVLKTFAKIQGNHLQKSVISVKLQAEDKTNFSYFILDNAKFWKPTSEW